jgi:hypothetical protein
MHFTLADLVTDICQNGAESGAALLELEVSETGNSGGGGEFRFTVRDNGKGMSAGEIKRAVDPFVSDGLKHPRRRVGLGLPFLVQTAEQSGGGWDIKSEKGKGATVSAWFDAGNVDMPPVGDIPGMFRSVLMFQGPREIHITRSRKGERENSYELRKTELNEALGNLEDTGSLALLDQYLRSLEDDE